MIEPSGKTVAALEAAVAAVKAAKVPKDLRVAAFNAAFYGGNPTQAGKLGTPTSLAPSPPAGDQSGGVEKIAAKLDLDSALVGLVYDVDDDGVHLTVKRDSLSSTNKIAQQEVTYLLAAGRQAIGLEEWTLTNRSRGRSRPRGPRYERLEGNRRP
jgi:hypothetical protein